MRKGARSIAEIPAEVLAQINRGETATVNLVEYLAADIRLLLPAIVNQIDLDPNHPALQKTLQQLPMLKPMQRHWAAARALLEAIGNNLEAEQRLSFHISDLARQWAALFAGLRPGLALAERLETARPFAADPHFGVREMAWLAVRDAVAADVPQALKLLLPWTLQADPNLRRFASELTRPRGVWCAHLESLKQNPQPGRTLLDNLRADPSRYVQNSVANWLNDAAKSRPEWVEKLCGEWLDGSDTAATRYICKRGQRSIEQKPATSS